MLDLRSIIRCTARNLRIDLTDEEIENIYDHSKYKRGDVAIVNALEAGFLALVDYRKRQRPL